MAEADDRVGVVASVEAARRVLCRGRRPWLSVLAALCAGLVLMGGVLVSSAYAMTDSAIAPGQSIGLPAGHGQYFFVGSTSGEQTMGSIRWVEGQNLAVTAPGSGDQAISVGHAASAVGSSSSAAGSEAIAGVGVDGYTVAQTFTAQKAKASHPATRHPEKPVTGAPLTLAFTTTQADQLVAGAMGPARGPDAPSVRDPEALSNRSGVGLGASSWSLLLPPSEALERSRRAALGRRALLWDPGQRRRSGPAKWLARRGSRCVRCPPTIPL